eukprot:m51a1_g3882 hypothetical protein (847) ;mRNA; r:41906-45119
MHASPPMLTWVPVPQCLLKSRVAVAALCVVTAVLFADLVVDPCGFLSYHRIRGRMYSDPVPCGWDYEGSWQVGWARGTSPQTLELAKEQQATFTCSITGSSPPSSFVADPFLVIPRNGSQWYATYEMKNLVRGIGEIGAAVSSDRGATWTHVGTALSEPFHLSYPGVYYDPPTGRTVMIPETHQSTGIRVYETTADAFPLGWKHVHTALGGTGWVDPSAVWWRGLWYVFVTRRGSLRLFVTKSLLGSEWAEHPRSPITSSKRYGRCGGPPVVFDARVWRYAQDDDGAYGIGIHVFRIDELTPTEYRESLVRSVLPGEGGAAWTAGRLHHVCAVELSPGQWIALADGDRNLPHHQCRVQEAAFTLLKRVAFVTCALVLLAAAATTGKVAKVGHGARLVYAASCAVATRACRSVPVPSFRAALLVALCVAVPVWLFALAPALPPALVHGHHASADGHRVAAPANDSLVIITAASSQFFDRLRNLVGSLHVWEGGVPLVIYDLGLKREQWEEASCWEGVQLRRFNFDPYPPHVRRLYNYAWKLLLINESFAYSDTILVVDAGLEIRRPLTDLRASLRRHGYFSGVQKYAVRQVTMPQTPRELGVGELDKFDKQFCMGGLQGFVKGSDAERRVLQPSVKCALREECICPKGSGRDTHNFDQSVISIMYQFNGFTCNQENKFHEGNMLHLTHDELDTNEVVIAARRWFRNKPYARHVRKMAHCPAMPADWKELEVLQHDTKTLIFANSPVQKCLEKNHGNITMCNHLNRKSDGWPIKEWIKVNIVLETQLRVVGALESSPFLAWLLETCFVYLLAVAAAFVVHKALCCVRARAAVDAKPRTPDVHVHHRLT